MARFKTKVVATGFAGALALSALAGPALAAAPPNPGCFGLDRAAYAQDNGSLGHETGGVGYYASLRAGDNGTINQDYMGSCGGTPSTP